MKLYVLENIKCKVIETPVNDICETLLVSANVPNVGNIRVCGIYRPPQNSVPSFIDYIEQLLWENCVYKCFFLGDMNINTMISSNLTRRYNNIMHSFSMKNMISDVPTYVPPNSDDISGLSCLDHIWHNLETDVNSYVLHPGFSDHKPCVVVFDKFGVTNGKVNSISGLLHR